MVRSTDQHQVFDHGLTVEFNLKIDAQPARDLNSRVVMTHFLRNSRSHDRSMPACLLAGSNTFK